MIRNRLSPSVSLIAFTAALACTESRSGEGDEGYRWAQTIPDHYCSS